MNVGVNCLSNDLFIQITSELIKKNVCDFKKFYNREMRLKQSRKELHREMWDRMRKLQEITRESSSRLECY